ncbi:MULTISPECIES: MFS transporter [Arthrobacter]|uniref:MFS transporter n=2 Tax=Arthrobacter TaxID=1663 RepID=A0ABU9KM69_9MICC|nr:MFS transporter [Arthrobacter sp. YJM1]MDP5228176.1 MFS transporter [Arthrobacter sp. YJM1]
MHSAATITRTGIFTPPYLFTTLGLLALVIFNAFESMAVTTVMPVAARELGGQELYALAFAGPMAASVIGMVLAGSWSDRRGPVGAIYGSVALFTLGLIIAGTAPTMPLLVLGRIIQGFAGGANGVALTVLVGKVFPADLHAKMFAAFAAAWVLPSIVGPYIGGLVAQAFSWHWVFLGVLILVIPALLGLVPALQRLSRTQEPPTAVAPYPWGRLFWSVVAAASVMGLNLSAEIPVVGWVLAVAMIALCIFAIRPLIPRGTLTAQRGLPSVVLTRAIGSAAFFGTEVYLPRTLYEVYHFEPSFAGLALTCSAVSWGITSGIQGRLGAARLPHHRAVRIGSTVVFGVVTGIFVVILLQGPAWLLIGVWLFGGAGMGLMFPRLSVMVLAMSRPGEQGFNSSALAMADSLGNALCVAVSGLVFAALAGAANSYAGLFAVTVLCGVAMLVIAPRTRTLVD